MHNVHTYSVMLNLVTNIRKDSENPTINRKKLEIKNLLKIRMYDNIHSYFYLFDVILK